MKRNLIKRLHKKYPSLNSDLFKLISQLETDPALGTSLGKGFYKTRLYISGKGKGKSGGGRIITCVKIVQRVVYLASIYDKSEKPDLSDNELKFLATQIG